MFYNIHKQTTLTKSTTIQLESNVDVSNKKSSKKKHTDCVKLTFT